MIWRWKGKEESGFPVLTGRARIEIPQAISTIYAIGDVHGCLDLLTNLEQQIIADAADRPGEKALVMLGDYVDRGSHSAQVIDHLLAPAPQGFNRICLMGNHEQAMLDFLDDPERGSAWMGFGALETLASYGVALDRRVSLGEIRAAIPDEHVEFLRNLPVIATSRHFVFAHAGLRPGITVEQQRDEDLIWIRDDYRSTYEEWGKVVVHGHTPIRRPFVSPYRIGIDTGAVFYGRLTGVRLEAGRPPSFFVAEHP